MSPVLERYAEACNKVIKYYPVWPPDSLVNLGDFGVVEDGLYEKKGNIFKDFDFKIKKSEGMGYNTFDFTEGVSFSASLKPNANIPEIFDASIEISFDDVSNVYFSFNGCQSASVDNSLELENKIISLYNKKEWKIDYYIVTGLVKVNNSTVILADNNNSKIEFKADVPLVTNIPIAQLKDGFLNGKINFSDTSCSNISLKIIAKERLIPLIKLSKLKKYLFRGDVRMIAAVNKRNGFPWRAKVSSPHTVRTGDSMFSSRSAHVQSFTGKRSRDSIDIKYPQCIDPIDLETSNRDRYKLKLEEVDMMKIINH